MDRLLGEVSFTRCSDRLREYIQDLPPRAPSPSHYTFPDHQLSPSEPYRVVLSHVRDTLAATRDHYQALYDGRTPAPGALYATTDELLEPLLLCYESLCETGQGLLAEGGLRDCIARLQCFGLQLVKLDIRQESGRHSDCVEAMTQYLGLGSYSEWPEVRLRMAHRLTFEWEEPLGQRTHQQPTQTPLPQWQVHRC